MCSECIGTPDDISSPGLTYSAGGASVNSALLHGAAEEPFQVLPMEAGLHAFPIPPGEYVNLCLA